MGDNRSALSAMRAARRSISNCADAAEELNNKLDEYIKNKMITFTKNICTNRQSVILLKM